MKKVAFHTLGCKLNFSETSAIARSCEEKGYKKVDFKGKADIYVLNTCSVTENADKECKRLVRQVLKKNPKAFVVIIGCFAQLKPNEISAIKGVDMVLGANDKFNLPKLLTQLENNQNTKNNQNNTNSQGNIFAEDGGSGKWRTYSKEETEEWFNSIMSENS